MNLELSSIQRTRRESGLLFEEFVGLSLDKYAETKNSILGKSSIRVPLKETGLTFDSDYVLLDDDMITFIEVKKSVSDTTITKLFCQYKAWFDYFMEQRMENIYNPKYDYPTEFQFLVVIKDRGGRCEKYLNKLKDLSGFKYCTFNEISNTKFFTKLLAN